MNKNSTLLYQNIVALILVLGAFSANADINLTFGVYASDKPTTMVKKLSPVIISIEKSLTELLSEPVSVQLKVANSYEKGLEQLVNGQVDFSRFGPASYVLAKQQNPNINLLAMESVNGKKTFKGIIAVHKDSSIQKITDLNNKRFAFGDEQSTIGNYLAKLILLENGISASNLSEFAYLGRHDKVGAAVAAGLYDAGALKSDTFEKSIASGAPLRMLINFDNVTKPWVTRSGLNKNITAALKETLLNMKDESALKVLKKSGFLPGTHDDYRFIEKAITSSERFHD